jgi:acetyl esterase/lipase
VRDLRHDWLLRAPCLLVALAFLAVAGVCCTQRGTDMTKVADRTKATGSAQRSEAAGKLRILCLHGYNGSAEVLRAQMLGLTRDLQPLAELVFVDAPSISTGDHGWWHAVDTHDGGVTARGWETTRAALVSVFDRQGPFDGVFGFSQGAALAGLLVGLRSPDRRPTPEQPLSFDFVVLAGGFVSRDPTHAALYQARASYDLPSLHILGRADGIVPPSRSRELAAQFEDPIIAEHDGGHILAADASVRQALRSFLQEMLRRRSGRRPGRTPRSPLEVGLWPGRARPSMRVFFPMDTQSESRPALIVFRGGGYSTSFGSGAGTAEWMASHGMVGIEVEYRTRSTGDSYPAGYDDAARAVRLVRKNAPDWGVDARRVGVIGYSAGGHLASLLSTQPSLRTAPDDDLSASVSARPDLVVLAYPLVSFIDGYFPGAFLDSAESFFGRGGLDESLRRQFSNELHVTRDHPPVFVWTTEDDAIVPYTHAKLFAEACRRAGVPVMFTLFPHGPHGLGLALDDPSEVGTWTNQLLAWLRAQWPDAIPR